MPAPLKITPETILKRNSDNFLANSLGDEIVMMNLHSGDYIGINSVGADIWNLLSQPLTVRDLIKKVLDIYDVSEERGTAEVTAFLTRMLEQDMLVI